MCRVHPTFATSVHAAYYVTFLADINVPLQMADVGLRRAIRAAERHASALVCFPVESRPHHVSYPSFSLARYTTLTSLFQIVYHHTPNGGYGYALPPLRARPPAVAEVGLNRTRLPPLCSIADLALSFTRPL
jgi:hypothetical protein